MTYKLPNFWNGLRTRSNILLIVLAVAVAGYISGTRGVGMLRRVLGQNQYGQGQPNEVVPFSGAGQRKGNFSGGSDFQNSTVLPDPYAPGREPTARVAANDPPKQPSSVNGNDLVAQAARSVQAESAVQAQIRFRIDVAGQNLLGNGQYVQLGDGPEKLLRFDLKLQVGQRVAALQQISGQQYYWIRRDLPPASHKVSRVNLRSIRTAVAKKHVDSERDSDLSGSLASPADDAWLLLGGLPALLESLSRDFDFGAARAGEIEFPGGNDNRAGRLPVWAVSGTWKIERWEELTKSSSKKKDAAPPLLPQRVDLVLGRVAATGGVRGEHSFSLFPYRVIYYASSELGRAGEGAATLTPIVSMEFFNVQTAANLDPRDFDYNPGEQEVEDLTAAYLQKLGLAK